MIKKFRDISLIYQNDDIITIACDSCSGVGELSGDIIKANGHFVGYRTSFVALAETLALGAEPIFLTNNISMPMNEYGKSILSGIVNAASETELYSSSISGSTEDNFDIGVTTLGITVIGKLKAQLPSPILKRHSLYLAGLPKVGDDVLNYKDDILTLDAVKSIKECEKTVDLLPVGSKGTNYEIRQMERTLNAEFVKDNDITIDLLKSAGPATCAIFAIDAIPNTLANTLTIPITRLGHITPK